MIWFVLLLVLGIIAIVCGFFLPVQQPARKVLTIIGIVLMIAAVVVLILSFTIWKKQVTVVPGEPGPTTTVVVTTTP